ncbi:hypothetical protein [Actinobacillus pleuropneumoniae]|uniref:Uncharacterized protein n=1 Tax=Actinobacillus pleuropneumoniae TaxID=715 RepID=A0ABM6X5M7_ACTPL|nr:hypothetical protein [Actinobacillus pleuropneumoniae]ASU15011.1 hypothetical protein CHY23_00198 [Actinobacillus pleuropneumoniae]AWG95616.1 hypothetical protein APPSER1_06455 [Actinobacillus pleuropneumoniae serovar 1 str. 4074]AXA21686.1 hypothetical protein DRF63_06450 [Actinobacillus pleuropneumoniae]EFL81285.1 hypothetical protein APP6_1480 [Actinobacillus pleuropneumoniae serovar 6 str. Femo]MBL4535204.1 hypothetical protein [Actinobacillus pleuropneumoniae]
MYPKEQYCWAIGIITYLFLLLGLYIWFGGLTINLFCIIEEGSSWNLFFKAIREYSSFLNSCLIGGVGGIVYCLRAVYINFSVLKRWDESYLVWYLIRPIISLIIGGVSYLFIKAGLVLFSSSEQYELNQLSILSLAFLSGLNVDKFLKKLESIGETVWGISPSNLGKTEGDKNA